MQYTYFFPERPLTPPEPETFTGYVTFACPVEEATVEVSARVYDDELQWDTVTIWYSGVEVSALIGTRQMEKIDEYFKNDLDSITEFDRDDY